jgi:hypothetical protein
MLGCIQPMSSPMMKRMFGFLPLSCAQLAADTNKHTVNSNNA